MTRYTGSMLRLVLILTVVMVLSGTATFLMMRSRASAPASATESAQAGVDVKDALPYLNLYSNEQLRSEFDLQKITPLGDAKLRFEMLVPKSWEAHPIQVSKQQLVMDSQVPVPLAEVGPRGRDDVMLEVRYLKVPPRVTLDRFMTTLAERSGYQIVARQRGDFNGRLVEDALVRMVTPQFGAVLTRITASRRGDLIFMVGGSAKEADYANWKRVFGAAALTFDPGK